MRISYAPISLPNKIEYLDKEPTINGYRML